MSDRRIRPKAYVRVKFRPAGVRRARWYWAIKNKPGMYSVVQRDGDECREEKQKDGTTACVKEVLFGKPHEFAEKLAYMDLVYGWLVTDDEG